MPSIERSLRIEVPPASVYEAFVDLSGWLDWNPHLREVTLLTEGPLAEGSKARIALKRSLFSSVWEVTEINPGRSFAWTSSAIPGLRLTFDHIAESGDGGSRATLRLDIGGPLALMAGLGGFLYGRNVERSLVALKAILEETGPAPREEPQPAADRPEAATEAEGETEGGSEAEAEAELEA